MKLLLSCAAFLIPTLTLHGQTPENSAGSAQIEALSKKIDQINVKIDALSQQVLKIEQQMAKPGVMIGEPTPSPGNASISPAADAHATAGGNTHIVARGETLTSIAKQHKVGVEELQKFNHIEDGRKLQAGQTIMIPPPSSSASASPSASISPSPAG